MMSRFSLLVAVLVCVQLCAAIPSPPVTTAIINLDLSPEARWVGVVNTILSNVGWEQSAGAVFAYRNSSLFAHLPGDVYPILGEYLEKSWPENAAELKGMAAAFTARGHYVSYEYLAALAFFHELAHSDMGAHTLEVVRSHRDCTGILVSPLNGTVLHARNLDNDPVAVLRNMTVHLQWTVRGRLVWESVGPYWTSTGFMTGIKKGMATVEENWRFPTYPFKTILARILAPGNVPQVFRFRHAFTSLKTFDELVAFMRDTPIAAPMYAIVSGINATAGAVLTLDPDASLHLPELKLFYNDTTWFVVQTNYDHWLPDPSSDPRRTVAEAAVEKLTRSVVGTVDGLFEAISTPLVTNADTVFTAIMRASTGFLQITMR